MLNPLPAFLIALTLTLFASILIPSAHLLFFPGFLIILFYRHTLTYCLWSALLCGTILDLLSLQTRLGMHAIAYVLTTALLYRERRHFFADSQSTLPIMTYFFSALCTLILGCLIQIFDTEEIFSWAWIGSDLITMPLFDALFAWLIFCAPLRLFQKRRRKSRHYFMQRRTHR